MKIFKVIFIVNFMFNLLFCNAHAYFNYELKETLSLQSKFPQEKIKHVMKYIVRMCSEFDVKDIFVVEVPSEGEMEVKIVLKDETVHYRTFVKQDGVFIDLCEDSEISHRMPQNIIGVLQDGVLAVGSDPAIDLVNDVTFNFRSLAELFERSRVSVKHRRTSDFIEHIQKRISAYLGIEIESTCVFDIPYSSVYRNRESITKAMLPGSAHDKNLSWRFLITRNIIDEEGRIIGDIECLLSRRRYKEQFDKLFPILKYRFTYIPSLMRGSRLYMPVWLLDVFNERPELVEEYAKFLKYFMSMQIDRSLTEFLTEYLSNLNNRRFVNSTRRVSLENRIFEYLRLDIQKILEFREICERFKPDYPVEDQLPIILYELAMLKVPGLQPYFKGIVPAVSLRRRLLLDDEIDCIEPIVKSIVIKQICDRLEFGSTLFKPDCIWTYSSVKEIRSEEPFIGVKALPLDREEMAYHMRGIVAGAASGAGFVEDVESSDTVECLKSYGNEAKKAVYLPKKGKAIVVGDLHGDFSSLETILEKTRFEERIAAGEDLYLVFAGDYVDRGLRSLDVLLKLIELKQKYGERVVILRGNHEGKNMAGFDVNGEDASDFYREMVSRYGQMGIISIMNSVNKFFDELPIFCVTGNGTLILHGGLPQNKETGRIETDLNEFFRLRNVMQILWNDFNKVNDSWEPSERGVGMYCPTKEIYLLHGINLLLRAHEVRAHMDVAGESENIFTIFSNGKGSIDSSFLYRQYTEDPYIAELDLEEHEDRIKLVLQSIYSEYERSFYVLKMEEDTRAKILSRFLGDRALFDIYNDTNKDYTGEKLEALLENFLYTFIYKYILGKSLDLNGEFLTKKRTVFKNILCSA